MRWAVVLAAVGAMVSAPAGLWAWRHHTASPRYHLRHGAPEEREWAIRELVKHGASPGEWEMIRAALHDRDIGVRLAAIAALGRSGNRAVVCDLIPLLEQAGPLILRLRALEALGELGGEAAWVRVTEALSAPEPEFRALAAACVSRSGRRDVISLLAPLLHDQSETVRRAAREAIGDLAGISEGTADAARLLTQGYIAWEAERGIRIRQNFEIAPSPAELARLPEVAEADPLFANLHGYSGDGWVRCLEGAGGNHEWLGGESGSIDIGRIAYPIAVPRAGQYRLWARMWLMDKCGDSYYAWFDNSPRRLMEHP